MHRDHTSSGLTAAVAILMVGVAIAMGWLTFSGTVFPASSPLLTGPLAGTEIVETQTAPLIEGMRIENAVQFSQPRDPFRPLITEDSEADDGNGNGNGNGDTTTPPENQTDGVSVTLQEIRDVNGTLRATVIVDGVTYDVGVGDTFADTFMVVSLDTDSGVFLNGDNAFTLSVGQKILK